MTIQTKKKEVLNGLLLLGLGAWVWWYASDFPELEAGYPGPALFPKIVGLGFMISGGFLLLITQKKGNNSTDSGFSKRGVISLLLGLGALAIFPVLQAQVGFVIGLGLLIFCFGLLLKVEIWKAVLTALLTTIIIYFIFVMGLGVSL